MEILTYQCPKCGRTGQFENWKNSPYKTEEQPIPITCGRCAMWKNYEVTDGRPKGQIFVVTQQY